MDVAGFLAQSHVLLVVGKGGVGKTTVSAALAGLGAAAGLDVLVVALDDSGGLTSLLGLEGPLGYEEVEDFPDTVDALIVEDGSKVYAAVNAKQHLHRRRFSLAHELGHYFMHRQGMPEEDITIDNPPSADENYIATKSPAEIEADLFAGELLVPLQMLKPHIQKGIPELSRLFLVSEQVISIAISRHMKALYK